MKKDQNDGVYRRPHHSHSSPFRHNAREGELGWKMGASGWYRVKFYKNHGWLSGAEQMELEAREKFIFEPDIFIAPNAAHLPASLDPTEGEVGWKIGPKGWIKVTFYFTFGWLTDDELFDLRQTDPRIAP